MSLQGVDTMKNNKGISMITLIITIICMIIILGITYRIGSRYILESIEENFKFNNFSILDGCYESVYFSDKINKVNISVNNINLVKNNNSHNLSFLLDILKQINVILNKNDISLH